MPASSDEPDIDELRGLTQAEVAFVQKMLETRYPGVDCEVREVDAEFRSRRPRPLYVFTSSLARRLRGFAELAGWQLAECERRLAAAVRDGTTRDVCLELEYGLAGALVTPIGLWFDGFLADEVDRVADKIHMSGKCWLDQLATPFEADIEVEDGVLARFALRCGSAHDASAQQHEIEHYDVVVQPDAEWPLEITLR